MLIGIAFTIVSVCLKYSHASFKLGENSIDQHKRMRHTIMEKQSRTKRYALEGSRWSVNEITYRISKYSTKLPKKDVDNVIKKALSLWEEVTNIRFIEQKQDRKDGKKVKLDIRFERGAHGDEAPFDGPGGFRAHAFFPAYGGDLHLDDDENWTLENSKGGVRLLLVATHELGHALGVGHSDLPSALMAPSHKEWKGEVKLTADDIQAVQGLYGKPGEGRPRKPDPALGKGAGPMVRPGGQSVLPFRPRINGPFRPPRGPGSENPFGPGGPHIVPGGPHIVPGGPEIIPGGPHFDPRGPPPGPGPPIFINPDPPRIPIYDEPKQPAKRPSLPDFDYNDDGDEDIEKSYEDIDSVIEDAVEIFDTEYEEETIKKNDPDLCSRGGVDTMITHAGQTLVFKGAKYWKLSDSESGVALGYPRRISEDFEGLPNNLDAAFTWKNGKTYFLKGSKYWRFSGSSLGKADPGFPKKISDGFGGIPNGVDAAFVWGHNGKIYFFKDSNYWKFDPTQDPPVEDSYPRPISNWKGVPNKLDVALQYKNGNTYFFKDNKYYRFNEESASVERESSPPYPRTTGKWWFGCSERDIPRLVKKKKDRRLILD